MICISLLHSAPFCPTSSGYIPPSVMIPQRRFSTLLQQAFSYQRQQCIYHNTPSDSLAFSLYVDHQCDKSAFPRITTTILQVHSDEVWNMEWSHDGAYLASAGKDKSAIIWRIGVSILSAIRSSSCVCLLPILYDDDSFA